MNCWKVVVANYSLHVIFFLFFFLRLARKIGNKVDIFSLESFIMRNRKGSNTDYYFGNEMITIFVIKKIGGIFLQSHLYWSCILIKKNKTLHKTGFSRFLILFEFYWIRNFKREQLIKGRVQMLPKFSLKQFKVSRRNWDTQSRKKYFTIQFKEIPFQIHNERVKKDDLMKIARLWTLKSFQINYSLKSIAYYKNGEMNWFIVFFFQLILCHLFLIKKKNKDQHTFFQRITMLIVVCFD